MYNRNFYFKDNVLLIEQGNTKLALLILASVNGHIISPAWGKVIANYKNVVLFSFIDSDFPLFPSPGLPSYLYVIKNVSSSTPNIIKPVLTKKF